jgi:hypothetical protein
MLPSITWLHRDTARLSLTWGILRSSISAVRVTPTQQSIEPTNTTQTWFYTLLVTTHLKSGDLATIRLQGAGLNQSPQHKQPIRIVCISDTYTNTVPTPPPDLLVHAAGLTEASQPHKEKIVLAGNHDSYFDVLSRCEEDRSKKLDFKDTISERSSRGIQPPIA